MCVFTKLMHVIFYEILNIEKYILTFTKCKLDCSEVWYKRIYTLKMQILFILFQWYSMQCGTFKNLFMSIILNLKFIILQHIRITFSKVGTYNPKMTTFNNVSKLNMLLPTWKANILEHKQADCNNPQKNPGNIVNWKTA